jgi:hypothetical protein
MFLGSIKFGGDYMKLDISHENIERITSERLSRLNMEFEGDYFYNSEFIDSLGEDDEISPSECGFMQGYLRA